jgi:hypothetical protein
MWPHSEVATILERTWTARYFIVQCHPYFFFYWKKAAELLRTFSNMIRTPLFDFLGQLKTDFAYKARRDKASSIWWCVCHFCFSTPPNPTRLTTVQTIIKLTTEFSLWHGLPSTWWQASDRHPCCLSRSSSCRNIQQHRGLTFNPDAGLIIREARNSLYTFSKGNTPSLGVQGIRNLPSNEEPGWQRLAIDQNIKAERPCNIAKARAAGTEWFTLWYKISCMIATEYTRLTCCVQHPISIWSQSPTLISGSVTEWFHRLWPWAVEWRKINCSYTATKFSNLCKLDEPIHMA